MSTQIRSNKADVRYVDQLDASEIRRVQAESHALWGDGMPLADRIARLERHLQHAGPQRFRVCGLIDSTGSAVSTAKLYEFPLLLHGVVCPTVGIGGVFTPERHRGEGYATQLLQMIAEQATQSGYKAALLFSDIAPEFYERLGYVSFPAFDWISEVKSLPSVRPFSTRSASSADAEGLRGLYESSWPREINRPHRDNFRWTLFREINGGEPDLWLCDGVNVVGYLTARKTETDYWVDEYVIAAAEQPRLWATIRSLAEESNASEVRGWQNRQPCPDHFRLQRREAAIPMLKFLDPTMANLKLDPQLIHFGSLDHF